MRYVPKCVSKTKAASSPATIGTSLPTVKALEARRAPEAPSHLRSIEAFGKFPSEHTDIGFQKNADMVARD